MYTLDTNAIIYYIKGEPAVISVIEYIFNNRSAVYISTITEAELFGFPGLSIDEEQKLEGFMSVVAIISVDSKIARIAASIRRNYHLKISDSIIAATALFTGTTLVTRNVRDFRKVPNLLIKKL